MSNINTFRDSTKIIIVFSALTHCKIKLVNVSEMMMIMLLYTIVTLLITLLYICTIEAPFIYFFMSVLYNDVQIDHSQEYKSF